jgi:RNA polymerase sigma-70 factor (ECF subfamily)
MSSAPLSRSFGSWAEVDALRAEPPGDEADRNVTGVNSEPPEASNRQLQRADTVHDHALVERARSGDRTAFRELVERHQRRALVLALALVRDEQDAREVVQEAFLRVHKSLHQFQGGSSFFTWLYRIVTNLSIDLMRKPARREVELDDRFELQHDADTPLLARIEGANPYDSLRRLEITRRIQEELDALPPYHRGVIVMREVHGMSYEEMAEAMGVSKGTIMSRLFHARQKLQRALADCYDDHVSSGAGRKKQP